MPKERKPHQQLNVRLNEGDYELIKEAAWRRKESVNEFTRGTLVARAKAVVESTNGTTMDRA